MISVIIPVYNAEAYLNRCFDSLLAQSFADWEAICVDDGSVDSSNSILAKYANDDVRVKVIRQENCGAATARNTGLRVAQGEYVFFLDCDDALETNCFQVMMNEVERHPGTEMVVARNQTINGNQKWDVSYGKPCYVEDNTWIRYQFFRDVTQFRVVPWNKLIKKTFLIENGVLFREGVICEDEYWSFYLYRSLRNMAIIDNITYFHHISPFSVMSTSDKQKRAKALFVIINDLRKDFDAPARSLQVYKYLEIFRNCVHPFISKSQSRPLYFVFFGELVGIKQYKIAFYWLINWIRRYRRNILYYKMIPEAYQKEVEKCSTYYCLN